VTRSEFWDRVEIAVGVVFLVGFFAWWLSLPGDCGSDHRG
jgi:hypothetical protein